MNMEINIATSSIAYISSLNAL